MKKNIIAPSLLSANFAELENEIKKVEASGCEWLHFDVMDGKFVPEISFGEVVLRSLKKITDLFMDVHLMIFQPENEIKSFAASGADRITIHLESTEDPKKVIDLIHAEGISAGISIKPGTAVEEVFPYLDQVEMVLVMSVNPGFGGQAYIEESDDRIRRIKEEIEKRNLDVDLQVDGGINGKTIRRVFEAGANVFVSGSGVFKGNIAENVENLNKILE